MKTAHANGKMPEPGRAKKIKQFAKKLFVDEIFKSREKAFNFCLGSSKTHGYQSGLNVFGLKSAVLGDQAGINFTAGKNRVYGNQKGLTFAGKNIVHNSQSGLSVCGENIAWKNASGLVAAAYSFVGETMEGLAVALHIHVGKLRGIALAPFAVVENSLESKGIILGGVIIRLDRKKGDGRLRLFFVKCGGI